MYKEASRLKLRFKTSQGLLSVENLWDLSLSALANSIKESKKILKKDDDDDLAFLNDTIVIDKENQTKFNILKDVYLTKKKEQEEFFASKENKKHNETILALIKEKEQESLRNMSKEDLEKLLK